MKYYKLITSIIFLIITFQLYSQDNSPEKSYPYFKPFLHVFTNYHWNEKDNIQSAFQITRSHLGVKFYLDKNFTGVIYYDATNPNDNGKLDRTGYLKQAYIMYDNSFLRFRIGMIPLKQFDLLENFWGHRFVYKSSQEQYGLGSYYDIGTVVEFKLLKNLIFDITAINGDGLFANQRDNTYKIGSGLTWDITNSIVMRVYYDVQDKNTLESTLSSFLGYNYEDKFIIGGEYNLKNNYNFINDNLITDVSLYTTYNITDKWDVFGRFDLLKSKLDDYGYKFNSGEKMIFGFTFAPIKYVRASLNYQRWEPEEKYFKADNEVYLNFEVKY